jgi:hypothetical protein
MTERSFVGEVLAELDHTDYSGISDYVTHQVIRELVARNKQLEDEFSPEGTPLHRVKEQLDKVDIELNWAGTGRGRIDSIRDLKNREIALESFVDAFEGDFVMVGTVVDNPNKFWSPIENLYWEAKRALEQQKDSENT